MLTAILTVIAIWAMLGAIPIALITNGYTLDRQVVEAMDEACNKGGASLGIRLRLLYVLPALLLLYIAMRTFNAPDWQADPEYTFLKALKDLLRGIFG